MEPQFFVVEGERMYGPVDLETVKRWAAEGRINARTTLRNLQDGSSALAGNVLNLPFTNAVRSPTVGQGPTLYLGPIDRAANSLWIWAVILSILATFIGFFGCVFWVFGGVAIVFTVGANNQIKRGDFPASKRFSWIAIGISILCFACTAGFFALAAFR